MNKSKRRVWIGLIIVGVIILITFISAPSSNKIYAGSTYNRSPAGYGAWYAFMQQQDVKILRWRKPFDKIKAEKSPLTLLQINGSLRKNYFFNGINEWIKSGNTLIVLGEYEPATEAEFTSMLDSSQGKVKIETRRRREVEEDEKATLKDNFGAVVWEKKLGKGKVIYSTTAYIAANAYQDYKSNFRYLANLVKQDKNTIYVDEYIHGFKDAETRVRERKGDLFSYLRQTPLFPALIQLGVIILFSVWAKNRRFGQPVSLKTRVVDNSEEYIQALAQVLEKAECNYFVIEMIAKEEQLKLQKALSLGQQLLDKQTVINAWKEQIKTPTIQLNEVLSIQTRKNRISERQLLSWLGKWQALHEEVEKLKSIPAIIS